MPRTIRRGRRALAGLLAFSLALAACGDDDGGDAAPEVTTPAGETPVEGGTPDLGTMRVGLVCGGMTPIVAQIAMNNDAFAESGLEVEKLCFDGGSEGVQALIGGSVDIFLGSFEHVASTQNQGLDMKAFGVINTVFPYWILTKSDSPYQSPDDLAGEVVGVTSPGSLSETGLRAAMADSSASFEDLRVIGAGSGATMRSTLDAGQIAAGMVSEPGISELTLSGEYRILWEPPFPYISIVLLGSESWAADNAEALTAFLDTLEATREQAVNDPEWAVEAMAEEGFQVDDAALREAVERSLEMVPEGLRVTGDEVASTADILMEVGRLEEPITIEQGFDFQYLDS